MSKRVWQNICQSVLKLCAVLFFSPVRFPYAEKRTVFEHRHVYSIWIGCYAMNLKWVASPPKKEHFENITFHIFTLRESNSAVGAFVVFDCIISISPIEVFIEDIDHVIMRTNHFPFSKMRRDEEEDVTLSVCVWAIPAFQYFYYTCACDVLRTVFGMDRSYGCRGQWITVIHPLTPNIEPFTFRSTIASFKR